MGPQGGPRGAMGAHKAVRINCDQVPDDPVVTARALAEPLKAGAYDLIFTGRQAIDDDHGQMPQLLAQALDLPCVTVIIALEVTGNEAMATREIEGGYEKVRFSLPAVVGANRKLNEPRYRSLKGIMQAKKKTIEVVETNLSTPRLIIEKIAYPPQKSDGKVFATGVEAVPEVVQLLREEAKVI